MAAFDQSGDIHDYRRRYAELVGVPAAACDLAAQSSAFRGPWRAVQQGALVWLWVGVAILVVAGMSIFVASRFGK